MKIGVSGLAVSNQAGLGRLARICVIALAQAAPQHQIHVYLRRRGDLELLVSECNMSTAGCLEQLQFHFPAVDGLNRLLLEEYLLPRTLGPLGLDSYLGLDFTLPPRPLAATEAAMVPDLLPFTRPHTVSWRARFLYRRGIRRSIGRDARLLCISSATRQALLKLYPTVPFTRVVYPAISPKLMSRALKVQDAGQPVQVRGSLHGFTAQSGFMLSVGVAGARKNTHLLVQTYNELVNQGHYRRPLVLVGGDGRYQRAQRGERLALETVGAPMRSAAPGAAIYDLGKVSDHELSDLYRGADLLVSFSAEEGFGYPVLEALAHGTPALVTAGSPMQEIAAGGIVATKLGAAERFNSMVSTIEALPLLRRETAKLDVERYSVARLGAELLDVLTRGDRQVAD